MNTTCGVCGKKFKMINNAHLNLHGLTSLEYDKRFPNSGNSRYPLKTRKNMGVKTSVNHELFNTFNESNVWLLGLITADGSYCGKSHPNKITLYSTDKVLIDEFVRQTNTQAKVYERKGVKGHFGKKTVYQIYVNSAEIVERLKEINAYGNKSNRNPFWKIPDEYKWSFIKGLFDGDGNFYKGSMSIAGRRELVGDVYKWICKQLYREPNKIYNCSSTDVTVYFQLSRTDTEKVFRLMEKHSVGTVNTKKYKKMKAYFEVGDGFEIL